MRSSQNHQPTKKDFSSIFRYNSNFNKAVPSIRPIGFGAIAREGIISGRKDQEDERQRMGPEERKAFEKMFHPRSIAILGISRTYTGLGGQFFLKNLQRAEFPGTIYLINPTAGEISGMKAYPSISSLPEPVDLAIICVPAQFVPPVLEECGRKGVRNIHILSSGFKELGTPEGIGLEEEIRRVAIQGRLKIIGPNCMGPYVPKSRLMPWGQIPGTPGSMAFLSQSGTLTQRISEHGHFTGMGISKAVSFGNAAVLDSPDYLEYLAEDEETKVIGLYLESVRDGRRFLEVAKRVNQTKPLPGPEQWPRTPAPWPERIGSGKTAFGRRESPAPVPWRKSWEPPWPFSIFLHPKAGVSSSWAAEGATACTTRTSACGWVCKSLH
jgi:succinyl-CoA synthetase alpha subunit